MIETELVALYKKTKKQLATLLEDMTFANFYRALQAGKRSYLLKNTKITKGIDDDWVNAIMKAIPNIDNIVNNPRKYMKRETDVVPIEKAKIVDSESVKHLASHTNLINSVENGFIKPSKILSAYNEESLELYENRFVATLITRVSQFIDRRYFLLGSGGKGFSSLVQAEGAFEQAGEETEYSLSMTVRQGADYFDGGVSSKVYEDLYTIRKYANSFKYSPFMRIMSNYGQVRPPIMNTNLLSKEPNYRACVELWDFIESYNKAGYKIEIEESAPMSARDLVDDFDAINMMQYIALKKKMGDFDPRRRAMMKCDKRVIKPTIEDYKSDEDLRAEFDAISINDSPNNKDRDKDSVIKDVLLRALRKEAVKRELEEQENKAREQQLSGVLQSAMDHESELAEARKQRNKALEGTIKDALREESLRAKLQQKEELKRAAPAMRLLKRQLDKIEGDDVMRREMEKREAKQNDELMQAVLGDLLRIEDEREYMRTSPLIIKGGENMPVPMFEERLPATVETSNLYKEMFTPPVRVDQEDWLDFKSKRKTKRNRFSELDLESAILKALSLERKRENKVKQQALAEQRELENARLAADVAEAEKQRELEQRMEREFAEELAVQREQILKEQSTPPPQIKDEQGDSPSQIKDEQGEQVSAVAKPTKDDSKNNLPLAAQEEHIGFWRRLFRKIFFWRYKK